MKLQYAKNALNYFQIKEKVLSVEPYGNGHINDTYLVITEGKKYILQRLNTNIFTKPDEVMENVLKVTSFLKDKIIKEGGNPERETINVVFSKDNKPFYSDETGFYRIYLFVEDTICLDKVTSPQEFYESAYSFGHFQNMLSDFPAHELTETIPYFHDTKKRFERFCQVVKEDKMGRAGEVKSEIDFVMERKELAQELITLFEKGELPLRVTHNDTKLNNIMFDKPTRKGICIIDLDTVMPGLAVNDFGDSIRFGASTGAEDEKDLSKISCDLELFDVYAKGFLEGCNGKLTNKEIEALPLGAKTMTFECGMRFLTDYLEGDVYFKIHREGHNLDRCRTQFKLVKDMEEKWEEMKKIIKKYQ